MIAATLDKSVAWSLARSRSTAFVLWFICIAGVIAGALFVRLAIEQEVSASLGLIAALLMAPFAWYGCLFYEAGPGKKE